MGGHAHAMGGHVHAMGGHAMPWGGMPMLWEGEGNGHQFMADRMPYIFHPYLLRVFRWLVG